MLTNAEINSVVSSIRAKYSSLPERKAVVSVYVPETDEYIEQDMYMPDIEYDMYYADSTMIQYSSVRFAFIGY
jgi:hypothetical protein